MIAAGLVYWLSKPRYAAPAALQNAIYVWQESWSPDVVRSIEQAAPRTDHLMLFAAEIRYGKDRLMARRNIIDWPVLARISRPITLVIRADDRVAGALSSAPEMGFLADRLREVTSDLLAEARAAGVKIAGVQLDLDCPTSRLNQYRELLDAVRPSLKGMDVSITALPTWTASDRFAPLVRDLSYFVLQVHSIKAPKTIQERVRLVERDKLEGCLKRASAVHVPFYVALPTYGYRLFFDSQGACNGFWAEGPQPVMPRGMQSRVVSAQPIEIAPIVRRLKEKPVINCRGIVWFRLPVASDTLNWPWATLQAVMAGREPRVSFAAELRRPNPGLYEIWVSNTGEAAHQGRLAIAVRTGRTRLPARDALGGWRWRDSMQMVEGPAPAPGERRMAGWFRTISKSEDYSETITLGEVQILP